MREYLKAIGFSDLNSRKKIDELINEIKKNPSRKNWFQIDEEEAIFIYEIDSAFLMQKAMNQRFYTACHFKAAGMLQTEESIEKPRIHGISAIRDTPMIFISK